MGRPKGKRSPGYAERRQELARRVFQTILEDGNTSLRAMAERTAVSRPTLRHYFGSREGAVNAALATAACIGRPHQERLAELPIDDARTTLTDALRLLVMGWRDLGVGRIHEVGLKTGLEDERTARTYVSDILEPLLQAVERLLVRLVNAERLSPLDTRQGALMLVSPVVMALLHQDGLGGGGIRPLGIESMVDTIVDAFCRAHVAGSGTQEGRELVGTLGR
ncbi:MAG TPA: hypothetical protein DFR83_05875 [Deltaproteobacteria bacterium]|nr:hypothetical protein [Deltaproteobacteria bacterium]